MLIPKMLNSVNLLVILLLTLGSSCEKIAYPKSSIGVVNNSAHDVQFYFAVGGDGGIMYPDTLPIALSPPFRVVDAGRTTYRSFGLSEENIFSEIPSDTLSIYIFH